MRRAAVAEEIRHLSPVETARRLGVTVKALRLYEARGLVKPVRTANGWRVYGPEAVARLHQVLALKGLGLPLQRIGELLSGRVMSLEAVLALQEQALAGDRVRLDRALGLVRDARRRLAKGEVLSIDDLTTLSKETTMSEPLSEEAWGEIFDPLAKKHFTPDDLEMLKERQLTATEQMDVGQQWADIIAEATGMMERRVDPTSDVAIDMARRWKALQDRFTGGDPNLTLKARAMWQDAMADPVSAPKLPFNAELWGYVGQAGAALKAQGG
jgi:DNA-binding transcriptional MerR regulator